MFALKLTLAVSVAAGLFMWVLSIALAVSCSQNARDSGLPTRVIGNTCYIQTPEGIWQDWERWRRAHKEGGHAH
jgi:hypothetical protein